MTVGWTPEYRAWVKREAVIRCMRTDAIEAAAPFRQPRAARVKMEVDWIFARVEELRANPDERPTGPYAHAIEAEVARILRRERM